MTQPTQDDFSHAPTTRAAIDKERIEELETEVERLTEAVFQDAIETSKHLTMLKIADARITELEGALEKIAEANDRLQKALATADYYHDAARDVIKETPPANDGPENLVKPGFEIEPIR